MNKKWLSALMLTFALCKVFGQEVTQNNVATLRVSDPENDRRLRLAISSEEYPVTPGDLYHLEFRQADVLVSTDVLVESDYTINLNVFGKLAVSSTTFAQLKPKIEKLVSRAYPRSMPSLTLSSIGIFQVFVKGEIPQSRNVIAWGLSRLNEVIEMGRSASSSIRNVTLISRDGKQRQYDIFKANRLGLAEENPYMKPGDVVVLSRVDRTVDITGEVRLPGKYQLLPDDQLAELVDSYGGGLTSNADESRIRVDTISEDKAKTNYLDVRQGYSNALLLKDGDAVRVPSRTSSLPIVFFEGAILAEKEASAAVNLTSEQASLTTPVPYNRLLYSFKEGETLSDALNSIRKSISPASNLRGSFIVRQGVDGPIAVDLERLLGGSDLSADIPLRPYDRIVVPAVQFYVSVYGEVSRSGTFPYAPQKTYQYYVDLAGPGVENVPENIIILDVKGNSKDPNSFLEAQDRIYVTATYISVQGAVFMPGRFPFRKGLPASYYISMAGGVDPEKSATGKVTLYDVHGKSRGVADGGIKPGDQIYVSSDNAAYIFNKDFPIVSTIVSVLATILTLVVTVITLTR